MSTMWITTPGKERDVGIVRMGFFSLLLHVDIVRSFWIRKKHKVCLYQSLSFAFFRINSMDVQKSFKCTLAKEVVAIYA